MHRHKTLLRSDPGARREARSAQGSKPSRARRGVSVRACTFPPNNCTASTAQQLNFHFANNRELTTLLRLKQAQKRG